MTPIEAAVGCAKGGPFALGGNEEVKQFEIALLIPSASFSDTTASPRRSIEKAMPWERSLSSTGRQSCGEVPAMNCLATLPMFLPIAPAIILEVIQDGATYFIPQFSAEGKFRAGSEKYC